MVCFPCTHTSPISVTIHGSEASSQLKPAILPWITVLWKQCLRTTDCFLLNSREVWGSLCWHQSWSGKAVIFLEPVKGMIKIQQLHASRIHSGFCFWFWFCFICLFSPLLPSSQAVRSVGLDPGPFWLPPPAWPKISCDSRSLISNLFPPAALTPFGHVARFQAPGRDKDKGIFKGLVVKQCELN